MQKLFFKKLYRKIGTQVLSFLKVGFETNFVI